MNLDEVKRGGGENETLRWEPESVFCEIGFDSKPISEMHCKGGTYLKLGVGDGNLCKEGRVARMTRRDERSKKEEARIIFLELKIDFKNWFWADSQMQANHRKSREQECGKIQFTKIEIGRTTDACKISFCVQTDFRNRPWAGSRLQQILLYWRRVAETNQKNEIKMVRGFFRKF